jgi:hypothetical protein
VILSPLILKQIHKQIKEEKENKGAAANDAKQLSDASCHPERNEEESL